MQRVGAGVGHLAIVREPGPGDSGAMTKSRALLLAVVAFAFFAGVVAALFVALDVEMIFLVGPLIIVGLACAGVYRSASRDQV